MATPNKYLDKLQAAMKKSAAIGERTTVAQARELLMNLGATKQDADKLIDAAHLGLDAWE